MYDKLSYQTNFTLNDVEVAKCSRLVEIVGPLEHSVAVVTLLGYHVQQVELWYKHSLVVFIGIFIAISVQTALNCNSNYIR